MNDREDEILSIQTIMPDFILPSDVSQPSHDHSHIEIVENRPTSRNEVIMPPQMPRFRKVFHPGNFVKCCPVVR
jgi:hypothetical protein